MTTGERTMTDLLETTTHGNRQADPQPPLPRQCLVILEHQHDEGGFIPSLVIENESGHWPMTGSGPLAEPWYFGDTIEEARATCASYNRRAYGLTDDDCIAIQCSSMFDTLAKRTGGNS
jgi:hypothetical protein